MPNTFAPDSVADPTIFGVYTSVKHSLSRAARKPATLAAAISNPARSAGWRSVVGAWSSIVGRPAVTAGRYRSNGGAAAGPDSGVITGPVSSAPPGAWSLAVTRPTTSMTVSSGRPWAVDGPESPGAATTTWARPDRSLTIRNVTDLSSRRRCSQPAILTCSPTWEGRSAARTREIIALLRGCARRPLGSAGEKGTRGATAPSRRQMAATPRSGPLTGARRRGIGRIAGL